MYLSSLKLENFRNYANLELKLEPNDGIVILLGSNAMGKTNILEAISLLAFPRSFRANSPSDLIKFEQNHYLIEGQIEPPEGRAMNLKIGYQRKPIRRVYYINSGEVSLKEYLTNFQTVLFTPEDLEILSGAPNLRRRLIDTILSQVDREYFEYLVGFSKVLKQRNALIKKYKERKVSEIEIKFWNEELIRLSGKIHQYRVEFIEYCSQQLPDIYRQISSEENNEVAIIYKFSGQNRCHNGENYEDAFRELIQSEFRREVEAGHTLFGPHRDDFELMLNSRSVAEFCSRGEKRSFSLALKFIEINFLQFKSKSKPVLLLDDVFSELDEERRKKLLDLSLNFQTIITTVEKNYFSDYKNQIQVYTVKNSQLTKM